MKFKEAGWFLKSLIIAGQLITSPATAKSSHSDFRHLARHLHSLRSPSPFVGLPHYYEDKQDIGAGPFYVVKDGSDQPLAQSPNFDPTHLFTAASHTKLVTALAAFMAMKEHPDLNTPQNISLLRAALLASDNKAAQAIALKISPEHTDTSVKQMLSALIASLGIANEFIPANASGLPDQDPRAHHDKRFRHDSFASAHATNVVAFTLAQQYLPQLKSIYEPTTRSDNPTNNLFWPLISRGEPTNSDVFMFCKTGSDQYQSRSTEVILITKEGMFSFFHFHAPNDPRDPIAGTAALILSVVDQNKLTVPAEFRQRVKDIARGARDIGPDFSSARVAFAHHSPKQKVRPGVPVRHMVTLASNIPHT